MQLKKHPHTYLKITSGLPSSSFPYSHTFYFHFFPSSFF